MCGCWVGTQETGGVRANFWNRSQSMLSLNRLSKCLQLGSEVSVFPRIGQMKDRGD